MSDFIPAAFVCATCFLVGFIWGGVVSERSARQEAVKQHVAHYQITNEVTGATEFQWNKQPEKP